VASIISESVDFKVIPLDSECLLLAEDCLPPGFYERLLWRKLTLKLDESAAETDLTQTLNASA